MKKNNKKGFTLVELVIVVAVMAVLVAVAIPTVGSIKASADKAVQDTNCRTMESIIKLKEAELSNSATGTAGANVGTIDGPAIKAAINAAKLGITSGTYSYLDNGTVIYGNTTPTGTSIVYSWTFQSNGYIS